jgi:hypothetical protein
MRKGKDPDPDPGGSKLADPVDPVPDPDPNTGPNYESFCSHQH